MKTELTTNRRQRPVHQDARGDYVLRDGTGDGYVIERSRCDTGPKLVGWLNHLLGKDWFTKEHAARLIQFAAVDFPEAIDFNM